ncbi:hypothetical protein IRT31_004800 [Salmonella enterica]|nr:hypothetical protein [Salmonella enterica]EGP1377327.1 hypothetical protein [Salmonella enterica]EGV1320001.1 hypothetical protein [Salmonella enterica]
MATSECRQVYCRHGESGATGTVAASVMYSGMKTRCPAGAGTGQRSRPGAKHDSPGSRQGSRPASAKTDREYQQQEQQEQQESGYDED